jgi:hypothetical protein
VDSQIDQGTAPPELTPTVEAAPEANSSTRWFNLVLPLAGLGLIGGGIVLALFSRSRNNRDKNNH